MLFEMKVVMRVGIGEILGKGDRVESILVYERFDSRLITGTASLP